MSETERSSHISLEIDQEIFVDIVQDGDTIEDATVSTEVTSFDRVGDAYVLEGAIVFAGFMERGSDEGGNGYVDALSIMDETMDAEQFHHRLPFVLRVPVKAQARGIVNVASRISDWNLDVVSAGWIRIQGDLTIIGLSAAGGYHFQCGAQEDGDLFFKETVETVSVEAPPAFEPRRSDVPEEEEPAVEQDFIAANAEADDPDVNYAAEETTTERVQSERSADESALSDDLQRLDRVFEAHEDSRQQSAEPVASFEFEDQVSDLSAPAGKDTGAFMPSKSFSDGGFRAAFEQPTESVQSEQQSRNNQAEGAATAADAETAEEMRSIEGDDEAETRGVSIRDSMWSFVDFDGPEPTCTLRYVIVEHEASLDDLAEQYGCSKMDLMRANRITPETVVHPGQSLALPVQS